MAKKDKSITWLEVVRFYFPDVPDKIADGILWGCTGFPYWWNVPEDGRHGLECACTQLSRIARRSGGDPYRAHCLIDHQMNNIMNRVRKREKREQMKGA